MRRLATTFAVLALVALSILFAFLATAGGGGSSRSSAPPSIPGAPSRAAAPSSFDGSGHAPGTSTRPKSLAGPSSTGPTPRTGPRTFTTGIADPVYLQSGDGNGWLSRTVGSGARFVLLWVTWSAVSANPPSAGTDPSDPANPAYDWGALDATVRAASARGLAVVLSINGAPTWAEGPQRPPHVAPGTWRPNAAAFGAFAKAVARRYSGNFNPGTGVLPRVRYFQAWTEPNFPSHLTPQWVRGGGRLVAESPIIYRGLLNAFYAGVKAVHASNLVLTAGTAPYGDPPGGANMKPMLFVRGLLCLTDGLAPASCPDPAHFDILAHDPYSFYGPLQPAYFPDDVSIVDMWKLTEALAVAQRTGRALPRIQHPVWVTEFGWNTNPPNVQGVPPFERAQWIAQGLFALWRQGINTATWFLIVDQPRGSFWQTGLYYFDGGRKADFEAFRFPFLVSRAGAGWAQVWGVSPDSGIVRIQALEAGGWRTLLRARVRARGVIYRTIPVSGQPLLRAIIGSDTSLGSRA